MDLRVLELDGDAGYGPKAIPSDRDREIEALIRSALRSSGVAELASGPINSVPVVTDSTTTASTVPSLSASSPWAMNSANVSSIWVFSNVESIADAKAVSVGASFGSKTRVMVALELYRARHGAYPDSLDQLAGDIVTQPPADPLHGLPFGYRLLDGDPDGRAYLLYSVGLDRVDDGGAELSPADRAAHGHAAALTTPAVSNADHVINEPRPVWGE